MVSTSQANGLNGNGMQWPAEDSGLLKTVACWPAAKLPCGVHATLAMMRGVWQGWSQNYQQKSQPAAVVHQHWRCPDPKPEPEPEPKFDP